jgi:hypothetical protein
MFALTSALEAMAARAGQPVQLSPRFLWVYSDKSRLSVESVIQTANRVGICRDELCPYIVADAYPYKVADLDEMPGLEALLDAQATGIKVQSERIAGKDDVMRAICLGHSLVTVRVIGGSVEHCEACIGYDKDRGMKIHGSGNNIYWEPWESLPLTITQIHKITGPWAPVPDPGYVEGDLPTFTDGVLTIPIVDVVMPFPEPWQHFQNVRIAFDSFGEVMVGDRNITGVKPLWITYRKRLTLPTLVYGGKRYSNVSLTNPNVEVLHYEAA